MLKTTDVGATDWLADYPPPRSLPLDQEAQRAYARAYAIGLLIESASNATASSSNADGSSASSNADGSSASSTMTSELPPPVSFTATLAALLLSSDPSSKWFTETARECGPEENAVFGSAIEPAIREELKKPLDHPTRPQGSTGRQLQLLTISARTVLQNAEGWAQLVGGTDIGVRHLIAAYVLNPPANHRRQLLGWGFQEAAWRIKFFDWVAQNYTSEAWSDARSRLAPSQRALAFEKVEIQGRALAWPGNTAAMQILERAAADHARRTDKWLRLQTLFLALTETAREDSAVGPSLQPLLEAIGARYDEAREEYFSGPPSQAAAQTFADLHVSPRVLNVLETARELARAGSREQVVAGRAKVEASPLHLLGALLSRRVDGDVDLKQFGIQPQALREALIRHAVSLQESREAWQEMLGDLDVPAPGHSIDLNSDEPEAVVRTDEKWSSDPLMIRADVEAFAALVASKNLKPPLSIGLFGPWGSGKTTFLGRLRLAVNKRVAAQNGSAPAGASVTNVVHVDFNAWHYAEGALVSSLVDTILRELGAFVAGKAADAGLEWLEQKRAALESTKRALEAAKAVRHAAKKAAEDAQIELADKERKVATSLGSVRNAFSAAWSGAKSGLLHSSIVTDSGVLEAIGDDAKSVEQVRGQLETIRARPAKLITDLGWPAALGFAALVLILPPAIGFAVRKLETEQFGQLLSSLTAVAAVVGVWLKAATKAAARVDRAVAQVVTTLETTVSTDARIVLAKAELANAESESRTAEVGVQLARQELARSEADLANAGLPAQMLNLINRRASDQSYSKELTTVSLARADLQAISQLLCAASGAQKPGDPRGVERVILYIDDLDRCKPEDVVRVLQLVHMLLAFELFVVVVAVDARWVELALKDTYRWIGDTSNDPDGEPKPKEGRKAFTFEETGRAALHVTPQDYLEKIFQVAFWLEPMSASRAAHYLTTLVRGPDYNSKAFAAVSSKAEINALELDYMRALSAYVGPSPRRVKRLVNAYRLIKARLSDLQLDSFVTLGAAQDGRSGPYQLVIGLLVIGTGAQTSATELMRELAECDPSQNFPALVEQLRKHGHPDWTMAAQVIETLMQTQDLPVSELRGWARRVDRFLLHGASAGHSLVH